MGRTRIVGINQTLKWRFGFELQQVEVHIKGTVQVGHVGEDWKGLELTMI